MNIKKSGANPSSKYGIRQQKMRHSRHRNASVRSLDALRESWWHRPVPVRHLWAASVQRIGWRYDDAPRKHPMLICRVPWNNMEERDGWGISSHFMEQRAESLGIPLYGIYFGHSDSKKRWCCDHGPIRCRIPGSNFGPRHCSNYVYQIVLLSCSVTVDYIILHMRSLTIGDMY